MPSKITHITSNINDDLDTCVFDIKISDNLLQTLTPTIESIISNKIASRIKAKDYTIWGKDAEEESKKRLGWVDAASKAENFIKDLYEYKKLLSERGLSRVVLAGMGGSSLAPEVICNVYQKDIVILDSTNPEQVQNTLIDLEKTVLVVSSKSGSTVETDSALHTFEQAFNAKNLDSSKHIVIVTDPMSPFEQYANEKGYKVFHGDIQVGGRFSALTAFGLVPSYLAGVNVESIVNDADKTSELVYRDFDANPAIILGAALSASVLKQGSSSADKALLVDTASGLANFADWAEQLIAESSGKIGKSILPIVCSEPPELAYNLHDVLPVYISGTQECAFTDRVNQHIEVTGSLGAQFLVWEVATAIACYVIGVNPFDQPNVESAKVASREILANMDKATDSNSYDIVQLQAFNLGTPNISSENFEDVDSALHSLFSNVKDDSYLAVMIYGDRISYSDSVSTLRRELVNKLKRPVTIGWGPRFLHSTGQLHKGGAKNGVFLQIQIDSTTALEVVGKDFTYNDLVTAQAVGDFKVLADLKLPVVRIKCKNNKVFKDLCNLITN